MHRLRILSAAALAVAAALTAVPGGAQEPARGPIEGDRIPAGQGDLTIQPIGHASFAMAWGDRIVYVDPVGGGGRYGHLPPPDLILITHQHPDHLDADTLSAVVGSDTALVVPQAVRDALPPALGERATVMANGESATVSGLPIEAVPAYNTTGDRLQYHPKGRDNGYVVTLGDARVYVAGDTEDVPEMRALRDIDVAFIPMNLPYTMAVEQAADAVRAFRPGIVYPYHSQGSDVDAFARLVGDDAGVEVRIGDWY
jgi:L-ascorbate metabolism protein UlaG (beta-lactamase superfamily)